MLLWLAHRAWNLFCDPRGDCLGRRGAFLSCDFSLLRIGSSSAVQSGNLDSLYSSLGTSSSSAWALGLILNGPESPDPLAPQIYKYIYIYIYNINYATYRLELPFSITKTYKVTSSSPTFPLPQHLCIVYTFFPSPTHTCAHTHTHIYIFYIYICSF